VAGKGGIILHKIIKACGLFSCVSSEPYFFPDIVKGASLTDETNPKEKDPTPFQRVYIDVDSVSQGETSDKFTRAGSAVEVEDQVDYKKNFGELILESQKKEADAYQRGVQDGHRDGYSQGNKDGNLQGNKDGNLQGNKDGYAKGHEAGVADGLKEVESVIHSLQQALQEIKKLRTELCLNTEKEAVRLSLAIAGKILLREPATTPKIIAEVVKKTFETITINAPVRIRMHPSELAYMRERRHLIPIEGEVTFIDDPSISCGGCVVESLSGDVDARIESQLRMIEEAFLPGMEKIDMDLERIS
jgi:flagellar biosynthesis/type III secretory pathway protein FliH